jgi:hypothetical protein
MGWERGRARVLGRGLRRGVVIDPFQNLLAPALFDCFREKTRLISNARARVRGPRRNFGRVYGVGAGESACAGCEWGVRVAGGNEG